MASFQPSSHLFERNISLNDLDSALDVREIVRKDVVVPEDVTKHRYLDASSNYTFVLPSFRDFSLEFRKFVFSFLVDGHIMRELEAARRLNWCGSLGRMVTVSTLGDGNCLMHAASIGMWSVNDRYQTLRKTVHEALVEDVEGTSFYHGRWKAEEERQILNQHGGYQRTEEQWDHEWEEVIRHVSQNEFPFGPNGAQFGSLEEIHIFVLANILRRTIIVMSDDTLRGPYGDSYSPINFGGVYLPLLWDSVDCVKSPLVIGYANGHFTAVVSIQDGKLDLELENQPASSSTNCMHAVPLVKFDGSPLPVHFLLDHEVPLANDRVRQYLDCAKVPFLSDQGEPRQTILVAKLHFGEEPHCMKALIEGYFQRAREEYQRMLRTSQVNAQSQPGTKQPALQIVQCQTPGCTFYGSTETGNRCSQCLNEYLRNLGPSEPSHHGAVRQISSQQNFVTTSSPTPQAPNAFVTTIPTTFPATTSAKCRTSGCKYAAVSNHGGLCERCFEAERNAEEMAASMNPMTLAITKHCANRVNGCEFFGLPEHHNLCSRCYRTFCLQMENTLATLPQTGLKPCSPALPGQPNSCQSHNCPHPGVPALYSMCVQCYNGCIHSFITSKGASVGSAVQPSPPQHAPPQNITRMNPVPTGGRRKGVLCASPGCFSEGISQFSDLCRECHARKSGPSPQVRNTPVSTAREASVPLTTRSPSSTSAAAAAAASNRHLTSAPTRSGSTAVTASRVSGHPLPAFTSSRTNTNANPGTSSSVGAQRPYQVTLPQAPSTESRTDKCALCGKEAELDGGLCKDCFAAGFQAELRNMEKRQASVSQTSSKQQGTFVAASSNNQGAQSTSQGMNQTEIATATATAKKMAVKVTELPCTTTGCLRFGTPEKNGLCEQCYPVERRIRRGSSTEAHQNQAPGLRENPRSSPTPTQNRQFGYDLPGPVQVSQPQNSLYAPRARQTQSNSGSDDISGQKCRGTNCTLFGTPETNGFCSRCFLESTVPLSYPHSVPDFSTASHPATVVQRCTVTGCDRTAAPERHGHCQDCFGMFYPDVLSRESFLNDSHR